MKKNRIFKILYMAGVLVIALLLVYFTLKETVPDLIPVIRSGDADAIQDYLKSSGTFKGILCLILLQMVQVWSMFIPGMPIQVAAGCVYGFFLAFSVCHLSAVFAQFVAISVWRIAGQKLEKWLPVDVESNSSFKEFLDSKAPPAYIVVLACMIPVMPNGLIALLASKMDISIRKYTFSVWIGSIINVVLCCAVGNRIIQGDWKTAFIFIAILVAIFLFMWFFRDKVLKLYYKIRYKLKRV